MSSGTTIWVGVDVDLWGFEGVFRGILEGMVRRVVMDAVSMLVAVTRTTARCQTQSVPRFSGAAHRAFPPAFTLPLVEAEVPAHGLSRSQQEAGKDTAGSVAAYSL